MVLKASNIVKSYGKKIVLNGLSLEISDPGLYGIVGENGSGKSTFLKVLIGYYPVQSGSLVINGLLGYCPQNPVFFPFLTVKEHFKYFCTAYDIDMNEELDHIHFLVDHLNYKQYFNEKVSHLSGGTLQKLNLSLALLHKPDLLILDEPYNGFDWETYMKFWELTTMLQNSETTILMVTHFINETARFKKIYNLNNGILE